MKSMILLLVVFALCYEHSSVLGLRCKSCAGLGNCSIKTCEDPGDVCYSCYFYPPVSVFVSSCVSEAECRFMETMTDRTVKCCKTDLCNN